MKEGVEQLRRGRSTQGTVAVVGVVARLWWESRQGVAAKIDEGKREEEMKKKMITSKTDDGYCGSLGPEFEYYRNEIYEELRSLGYRSDTCKDTVNLLIAQIMRESTKQKREKQTQIMREKEGGHLWYPD